MVRNGADVNVTNNKNKDTALVWASLSGHLEIVKYLVQNGADVNGTNDVNNTALIEASLFGHIEVAI